MPASKPPPPVNLPVRRSELTALILSMPPTVLMYLEMMSSAVCASSGKPTNARTIASSVLRMMFSSNGGGIIHAPQQMLLHLSQGGTGNGVDGNEAARNFERRQIPAAAFPHLLGIKVPTRDHKGDGHLAPQLIVHADDG